MNRLAFRRMLRREAARGSNRAVDGFGGMEVTGAWHDELSDPSFDPRNTPAASGTAREAPSASLSGDAPPARERRTSDGAANESAGGESPRRTRTGKVVAVHTPPPASMSVIEVLDPPHRRMALSRLANPFPPRPAVDRSRLPIADSREPCRRCGVRGDIGCDHQRPMETNNG